MGLARAEGCDILDSFPNIREDLKKIIYGNYFLELVNEMAVEQQIQRAAMGSGMCGGVFERILWQGGKNLNANYLDYWFPTALDVPPIEPIIVVSNDPFGPFGAKEGSLSISISMYSAIACAIHDALGIWPTEAPFTPEKILQALEEKRSK